MNDEMFNLYKANGETAYLNAQDNTILEVSKEKFFEMVSQHEPTLRHILSEVWDYGINKPAELIEK